MKSEGLGYAEIVKGSEVLIDGMEGVKSMLCGGRTRVANVRSIDRRPLILCYGELPQRVPVMKLLSRTCSETGARATSLFKQEA